MTSARASLIRASGEDLERLDVGAAKGQARAWTHRLECLAALAEVFFAVEEDDDAQLAVLAVRKDVDAGGGDTLGRIRISFDHLDEPVDRRVVGVEVGYTDVRHLGASSLGPRA
jgi:hypothetical protein